MLLPRIIVCLDVANGRVVKGVNFVGLKDVGDPVELAVRYEAEGADEIVFLDIAATPAGRGTMLDVVSRTADRLFIPLTVGGGIQTVDDVRAALRAGADKVGINSAAVKTPHLLSECAAAFGSQCVVASIDAKRTDDAWRVYVSGGRTPTSLNAIDWAVQCEQLGAGEILLTSIDRDGARSGYDLELTREVTKRVHVPVIASGGAGHAGHLVEAFMRAHADAALVAGILHEGQTTVVALKQYAKQHGVQVRTAG